MRRSYLSRQVLAWREENDIVDGVIHPLRNYILSCLVSLVRGQWSIHHMMGDRAISLLKGDLASKGNDKIFQGVDGSFSIEEEGQALEQFSLSNELFLSSDELLILFSLLELLRDVFHVLVFLRVQQLHDLLLLVKGKLVVKLCWYINFLINSCGRVLNADI